MAGPDLPRPPIEDQLGSGVAGQRVSPDEAEQRVTLPDGYSVGPWRCALFGPGMYVAEVDLETPRGPEHVVINVSTGVVNRKPIGPQATSPSVGARA